MIIYTAINYLIKKNKNKKIKLITFFGEKTNKKCTK